MEETGTTCEAKFTMICPGKKIDKELNNVCDFQQGIEMKPIENGDKWVTSSLTFKLNETLEFTVEILNEQGELVEQELQDGQKHRIELTENQMDLQWTCGFDRVENEIDWDKIILEQEKAFNETKEKSEQLINELKIKNEEQSKQMDELANSMKVQQEKISELNTSIQDYTKKVTELAEKNKEQMEEFETQKQKYLEEMKQFEEQQKQALENLKLNDTEFEKQEDDQQQQSEQQ